MKIVLCNPEVSQNFSHSRKGMYPPLGLLSLATRLDFDYSGELEISVIDGDTDCIDEKQFKGANIAAFHVNSFNYENVLKLSKAAKDYGAKIVYGGPHATVLWKNIMTNRDFVDFIVLLEGEIPMSLLAGKLLGKIRKDFSDIPNLVYRTGSKADFVYSGKFYDNKPGDMIIPSREYVDAETYIENAQKIYEGKVFDIKRPFSIYSGKGCSWRERSGGCVFCARLEKCVKYRGIDMIWQEIKFLKERYQADHIWDISDDNLNNVKWFKKFVDARPKGLEDLSFLVYSRVNGISDESMAYLKKLNVYEVYLGFESGDSKMLQKARKGASADFALKVAGKLVKNGIHYFPSFVLGLPEETEESLNNTYKFLGTLKDVGGFYRSAATILIPLPGSQVFTKLLEDKEAGAILNGADLFDVRLLQKIWIKNFTEVSYEMLEEYQKRMNDLGDIKTFGITEKTQETR